MKYKSFILMGIGAASLLSSVFIMGETKKIKYENLNIQLEDIKGNKDEFTDEVVFSQMVSFDKARKVTVGKDIKIGDEYYLGFNNLTKNKIEGNKTYYREAKQSNSEIMRKRDSIISDYQLKNIVSIEDNEILVKRLINNKVEEIKIPIEEKDKALLKLKERLFNIHYNNNKIVLEYGYGGSDFNDRKYLILDLNNKSYKLIDNKHNNIHYSLWDKDLNLYFNTEDEGQLFKYDLEEDKVEELGISGYIFKEINDSLIIFTNDKDGNRIAQLYNTITKEKKKICNLEGIGVADLLIKENKAYIIYALESNESHNNLDYFMDIIDVNSGAVLYKGIFKGDPTIAYNKTYFKGEEN